MRGLGNTLALLSVDKDMSNELAVAAALRDIGRGFLALGDAIAALPDSKQERTAQVLEQIPGSGIKVHELSQLMRDAGINPRSIGSWVRFGLLEADEHNAGRVSAARIYYRGEKS